jgi:hypothetical protein
MCGIIPPQDLPPYLIHIPSRKAKARINCGKHKGQFQAAHHKTLDLSMCFGAIVISTNQNKNAEIGTMLI